MIGRNVGWILVVGLALAGCGGGGSGSSPVPSAIANGTTGPIGSGIFGTLSLTAANGVATTDAHHRNAKFVSAGAVSAGVSINGGTVTYADVSPTSSLCSTTAGVRTCTISVGAPAGQNAFAVSLYSAANGGGQLLSSGSNSTTVVAGTPFTVAVGLNPVAAGVLSTTPSLPSFTLGTASSVSVVVTFADPAGQPITGSGNVPNFLHPIAVTFSDPHVIATPSTITTPGQPIVIAYDGNAAVAASITVSGTTNGTHIFGSSIGVPGLFAVRYNLGAIGGGGIGPQQLVVGPDNNIWWTESSTNLIGRINPAVGASSIVHFPTGFTGSPIGIAKGGDGNIYYSNGGQIIARMTTSGTQLGNITVGAPGSNVRYLTTDSQGNVWYLNIANTFSQVAYVDMAQGVHTFGSTPTANSLGSASNLILGSDNAIWFTENSTARNIGRISTPANGTAGTYFETGVANSGVSTFPWDITSGPDGNLWFCEFASIASGQFFAKFIPAAGPPATYTEYANVIDPNAFANLVTIFSGADGNVWMAEGGGAVKIPPANPTGAIAEFFTDDGQTTMNKCISGPDGNLWCTAVGSPALGQGFIATADSIVTWVPR